MALPCDSKVKYMKLNFLQNIKVCYGANKLDSYSGQHIILIYVIFVGIDRQIGMENTSWTTFTWLTKDTTCSCCFCVNPELLT